MTRVPATGARPADLAGVAEPPDDARPVLSPHALLRPDAQGDRALVVLPERAVRLEGSAEEILALCDGTRTVEDVARGLRDRYPDAEGLEDDVRTFLARMHRIGALVLRRA